MRILKLSRRDNVSRMYAAWWDIYNLVFVVLAGLFLFVFISLAMVGAFDSFGAATLRAQFENSSESGLKLLGFAISGAIAAGLWILNKGIERWAIMNRIHHLHSFTLKILLRQAVDLNVSQEKLLETIKAYSDASKSHFTTISLCHPSCQNYYEELRFLAASLGDDGPNKSMLADICTRILLITLMSKGQVRLNAANDPLLTQIMIAASALEHVNIRSKPKMPALIGADTSDDTLRPVSLATETGDS